MAGDAPTLGDFITLGETFRVVQNPQIANIDRYTRDVTAFLKLLLRCNLTRTQTAANPLDGALIHYFPRSAEITPAHRAQLQTLTSSIRGVLLDEANSKSVIITEAQDLPKSLLDLPARLRERQSATQQLLTATIHHLLDRP